MRSRYDRVMFTGIVEAKGTITASTAHAFGRRLTVDVGDWRGRSGAFQPGDSVAVQGVCLTIAEQQGGELQFDVITETLSKTTLGDRGQGDVVNLESALTAATPMGGHIVQGHVDSVGRVIEIRHDEHEHIVAVRPLNEMLDYLTPKGSVTIDGVSLTIAALRDDQAFEVALIPTTLSETTLGELKAGDPVNLEADTVAKTVVHWLRRQGSERAAWRHSANLARCGVRGVNAALAGPH